ncbi:hypothetical protein [Bradyrhizobium sp. CCBAU 11357]|uniref:hypothetical protein n=1 Tax=Bradyrhizobium sp. CCBAU 11357 TaxID=1630808 RepID=UPI0023047564|nr:hypothetical protein [Bradyrhizobium sp. CCBAU 11357]MDA9498434.1 hypothetical protein [Bradyrhizobium sp. CCBAU 11357]
MSKKPTVAATVSGDRNAAIAAERLRIAAILESPEGKRNPAMAQKLALGSVLDAETARSILAEAPAANPYLAAADRECPIGLSASTVDIAADPKAARLAEIKVGMNAFNASRKKG